MYVSVHDLYMCMCMYEYVHLKFYAALVHVSGCQVHTWHITHSCTISTEVMAGHPLLVSVFVFSLITHA